MNWTDRFRPTKRLEDDNDKIDFREIVGDESVD